MRPLNAATRNLATAGRMARVFVLAYLLPLEALPAAGGLSTADRETLLMAGDYVSTNIAAWGCVGDLVLGDLNCDAVVDEFDIDPFVMALVSPTVYELTYPDCDIRTADCNYDGDVDAFDIDPFVELLSGP